MSGIKWPHMPHPRHISAIVEEQAQRFAIREQSDQLVTLEDWPVVTISYEYGVPGLHFGRRLAERLDFDSWDRERVTSMARRLYRRANRVPAAPLWTRSTVDDFLSLFTPEASYAPAVHSVHVHSVLDYIRRQGRSVIVGRGVQWLIDPCPALHLRLVAPIGQRVHWVAMRNRIDLAAARKRLLLRDKNDAAIECRNLGREGEGPPIYDLVINMATFAHDRAVGLVLMAYLAKFGKLPAPVRSHTGLFLSPIVHLQPPIDHFENQHGSS